MCELPASKFKVLVQAAKLKFGEIRITRLYVMGHDNNLPAFEEEAAEVLPIVCREIGDKGDCNIVGEARWAYLRFTPGMRAIVKFEPFEGSSLVTMIRVHRNNTPQRKKRA